MIYLSAIIPIICGALKRIFSDSRPMDILMLVIELLILLLIGGEVIIAVLHWWNKRFATAAILVFLADGQRLHDSPPNRQATEEEAKVWVGEVTNWIVAVQSFLKKHSKSAGVVFDHHSISGRYTLKISLHAEDWFYELDSRIKNLRSIMERVDVYF